MSKQKEINNFKKFWKNGKSYIDNRVTVNTNRDNRVELTINGNRYAVYSAIPLIAPNAPTFNPTTKSHTNSVSFKLSTTTADSSIYYTYTSSGNEASLSTPDPTEDSSAYTSAVTLSRDPSYLTKYYQVKAIAECRGELSQIKEQVYAITGKTNNPTLPASTTITADSSKITMGKGYGNSSIYYTKSTEGDSTLPANPTTDSSLYQSGIVISGTTSFRAKAVYSPWEDSGVESRTYTFKTTTPVITYSGNQYSATRKATITCANTNSTIYYTIGGYNETPSDPSTSSTVYDASTTITLDGIKTIKAFATKPNRNDSDVVIRTCDFKVKDPTITVIRESSTDYEYDESVSFNIKNNDVGDASISYNITGDITGNKTWKLSSGATSETVKLTSIDGPKTITISSLGTRTNRNNSNTVQKTSITFGRTPLVICTPNATEFNSIDLVRTGLTNGTLTLDKMVSRSDFKYPNSSSLPSSAFEYDTTVVGMFMVLVPKYWNTGDSLRGKIKTSAGLEFNLLKVGELKNWYCYSKDDTTAAGAISYVFTSGTW